MEKQGTEIKNLTIHDNRGKSSCLPAHLQTAMLEFPLNSMVHLILLLFCTKKKKKKQIDIHRTQEGISHCGAGQRQTKGEEEEEGQESRAE
jgi:hypothetical protein